MEGELVLEVMDYAQESEVSAELLNGELGDSYSNEDADRLLSEYEKTHGRTYLRPTEPIEKFRERTAAFRAPRATGTMDRRSATDRLKMLRAADEPAEADKKKELQKEIHGLEEFLGIEKTDFKKPRPTPTDAALESKRRFNAIEFEKIDPTAEKAHVRRTPDERLALIRVETDAGALQMVMVSDEDPEVHDAAESRLGAIELDSEVMAAIPQRPRT